MGVTGTVTNTRRPLPESNQAAAAECHRCAPARASPRPIPPIPQERSARLVSRPQPRRGRSPAQYSAPSLAAGAAGVEGAAHKPPRRARPLSRRVAAMASRCRWTAMAQPTPVRVLVTLFCGRDSERGALSRVLLPRRDEVAALSTAVGKLQRRLNGLAQGALALPRRGHPPPPRRGPSLLRSGCGGGTGC